VPAARLSRVQLDDLAVINAWLARGGPNGTVLPLRERSYDIFDDEKRLDLLVGGVLFRPGRLTLERLGATVVHPPFVAERISRGDGPPDRREPQHLVVGRRRSPRPRGLRSSLV
jgi:hypothetical protein